MTQARFTNEHDISLPLAVFLAHDDYDYDPKSVSATKLLKPIRQTILASRVPKSDQQLDISTLVQSRVGQALHTAMENIWEHHYQTCMTALGYSPEDIDRIVINPEKDTKLPDDAIPVYMENRSVREFMGFRVSGKYDFVAEGRVEDFKSTSVFVYMNDTKADDYRLQGSIYRWLNPDIIKADTVRINFIFTDYTNRDAKTNPKYPKNRVADREYPLLSVEETEAFIAGKLTQLQNFWDAPEDEIPHCTDKELWRSDPVYKYYKNPAKMARATKNFTDFGEALNYQHKQGGVGIVVTIPGQVKACGYCSAYSVCTQKDELINDGSLIPLEEVA